jgi:putative drug exporter of the RND superfamily
VRRLAHGVVHGRWWVIGAAVLFVAIAAALGSGVAGKLSAGGFDTPGSESYRAANALVQRFPTAGEPDFVVVLDSAADSVDAPSVSRVGLALTNRLAHQPAVIQAGSYWTLGEPPQLKSTNGRAALIIAALRGTLNQRVHAAGRLAPLFTTSTGSVRTAVTGTAVVDHQVSDRSQKDLRRSELITTPVVGVALVLVFGSLVAALLPLVVGVLAIVGTLVVLRALAAVTEVSIFSMNLTTALGLGLAVDYALFIVSRYREELVTGVSTRVAVGRSMQTAGRTVAFSAGTVMISLLSLLVFPQVYLRSFAYAGAAVVGLAAAAAIVVLPAVLVVLGPRIEKGRLFAVRAPGRETAWSRQARRVMRHPVAYGLAVTAVLLALAVPFLGIRLGQVDDRVVPPDVSSSRRATDQIRQHFASRESSALRILLPGVNPTRDPGAINAFAERLRMLPGVARVDAATGFYFHGGPTLPATPSPLSQRFFNTSSPNDTWVSVVPSIEPISSAGEKLVADVRATRAPFSFEVAGQSARFVDAKQSIIDRLPIALGLIALVTLVLLFLMTGSLLVPVKALLLNVLSLTATFGAMVFIFQDGRLAGLLGYTPTGFVDIFTPVLVFCIAFGLSMDYEVFLLSRIKEEYDVDRDNERAVAVGLGKTGRIVTAAAVLLAVVFLGLTTSEVLQVKLFGLVLTLAVLVDAFLIRATLVPAFMRLAGRANWWSPRSLRRWHLRYGIWENEPIKILDRAFDDVPSSSRG